MQEVNNRLLALATKQIKVVQPINLIGLSVPVVRAELKKDLSFIGNRQHALKYWDGVWQQSPYFESMSLALYFYQHKTLSRAEFFTIKTWVDRCTCWQHSDDLSKIYALAVENTPEWVLPVFRQWNRSDNLWKRRQSVVGLLEYASKRKRVLPFAQLIDFVEPLLADKEYYVQKGVGWTLREIYNVYPKETLAFMQQRLLQIKPIAYPAATEKLAQETKLKMNAQRKNYRLRQQ